ncbi:NAD(P)-dependent oxidoreductase [Pedobacter sp. JCM 36344]|uniref:NAD(P)-dependent oxidoreductase n=1 Tax=Pedobacter sp. JCM 36344 TaxID=3374280 RepID=UPI003979B4DF
MTKLTIGWIGLGTMGIPMANSLIKSGYELTVYNRNPDKAQTLQDQGAVLAGSPAELMSKVDIVIIMVTDDKAINEIFEGANGLLSSQNQGKTIINMSTVSPGISIHMQALCSQQGNHYLDAPVSGSVKQATEATLVIIAGGDAQVFEKVKPVLETIGKLAIRFGDVAAGNRVKLIVNTFLAIQAQALAEAMRFAEDLQVDKSELMNVLNNSALASPFIKIKGEAIVRGNFKPAFSLNNIVKDLKLAEDIGLNYPLGKTALDSYQSAASNHGLEDIIGIFNALKNAN